MIAFLVGIGGNLIAAVIGFALGWAVRAFRNGLLFWRVRRFWGSFIRDDVTIIMSRFPQFAAFEPTGLVGAGDANATAELRAYLARFGQRNVKIVYADEVGIDQRRGNLIVLGGPDANEVARQAMMKIAPTLHFGNSAQHEVAIFDSVASERYTALKSAGDIVSDVGLLVRASNPFDTSKQILIFAGSFGFGTWASARFAMSRAFLRKKKTSNGKPVELLVQTDVFAGAPQAIRLLVARPLGNG